MEYLLAVVPFAAQQRELENIRTLLHKQGNPTTPATTPEPTRPAEGIDDKLRRLAAGG